LMMCAPPSFFFVSYVAFVTNSQVNRVLLSPSVRFLGRISYSIFLLHFPIRNLLMMPSIQIVGPQYGYWVAELWLFFSTLVVTIPAAYLSYRFIERPFIKLGYLLSEKIEAFSSSLSHRDDRSPIN
jgi:peptidoglycan/LPS O-acetylase OafA/YrhL